MRPAQARRLRNDAGLTQQQAAAKLGLTQAYLSMLENGKRPITPALAAKLARQYGVQAPRSRGKWTEDEVARQLGNLGYPGFGYLRSGRKRSPTELLAWAFSRELLDARLAEALPWVILHHEHSLDWDRLVKEAKLGDAQNRLGFLLSLARGVAERLGDERAAERLQLRAQQLDPSRLVAEGTFFEEARTKRMLDWLRDQQSADARHWRILTDVTSEKLRYIEPPP